MTRARRDGDHDERELVDDEGEADQTEVSQQAAPEIPLRWSCVPGTQTLQFWDTDHWVDVPYYLPVG